VIVVRIMKRTLVLLAVTKMRSGFCLAGVDPLTGEWIRPVKEFGGILAGDMTYPDRAPFAVCDRVELVLGRPRPQPPHMEDWTCDFVRERPRRLGVLRGAERAAFLMRAAESDAAPVVLRHERSLILVPAADLTASFSLDAATRKLDARIACPALGLNAPVPVTDLRWRALGRVRYAPTCGRLFSWPELRSELGVERVYLALGLSREFEGRLWPLVVGVHCVPDYEAVADFRNP
jgi:hypothetical protein